MQRDDPAILLEEAEDWLREEGILFPAESTLLKIIAQVLPQAESQLFAAITKQLSATQAQALEELLQREQGKRGSTFAWLKEPAVKASPVSIKVLLSKLETVRALQMSSIDVSRFNRNRVRVLAHLGAKYHRDSRLAYFAAEASGTPGLLPPGTPTGGARPPVRIYKNDAHTPAWGAAFQVARS